MEAPWRVPARWGASLPAEDAPPPRVAEARKAEPHGWPTPFWPSASPVLRQLRAAETALASAREQREAARDASEVLRQELEQERSSLGYVHPAVRRAAAAVLAASPAVEAAVERLERAEAELVDAGDAVRWLAAAGVLGVRTPAPNGVIVDESPRDERARRALRRLDVPASGWLRDQPASTESWEAVLAELEMDARRRGIGAADHKSNAAPGLKERRNF